MGADTKSPRLWVEFDLEAYPSLTITTYRWGQRPVAASTFLIEGRIPADGLGDIIRRASSSLGEYSIDSATVTLRDYDGLIRYLLSQPSTQWFKNRFATVKLLSEAGWTAALTPRTIFIGRVYDVQLADGRKATMDVEDILAPYIDKEYPQYTLADAYPQVFVEPDPEVDEGELRYTDPGLNMALGLRDQVMPIYYGPFVDSAVDPVTDEAAGKGMCPTYFIGYTYLGAGGWGPQAAWAFLRLDTNPSDGDTVTIDGNVFTFRNSPAGPNDVQIGATAIDSKDNLISVGNGILTTVDLSVFDSANEEEYIVQARAVTPGGAGNSISVLCSTESWFGEGSELTTTLLHGFDEIELPEVEIPEPSLEMSVRLGTEGGPGWGAWGELHVGLGEYDISSVYISNGVGFSTEPAGSDDSTTARRIVASTDRYGIDILAPGHPNWPFPTNYVMRNGFRTTVIYARGPVLWHHVTGVVNITVDLCGWKNADGDAITQAGFAYQDFLTQHVLANNGAGYTSGPPVSAVPTFANGNAMFWTSRIQDWQALTGTRLNTADGYLISMALNAKTTLREILRNFHVTFDCYSAKNSDGQLYLFSVNDLAEITSGTFIRERIELVSLPAPQIAWTEIENSIDYTYGWDPEQDTPRTPTLNLKNDTAIEALKEERKPSGVRDLRYTSDDATAIDTISRRVMRLKQPPRYQTLPVRLQGVDRQIGDQVLVSHQDGFGTPGVGYLNQPMTVVEHRLRNSQVDLVALDTSAILMAASRWAADSVPNWDSATEAQQAFYGFWADSDDTLGVNNDPATEWR